MPLPARALESRLQTAVEAPSWGAFLPPEFKTRWPAQRESDGNAMLPAVAEVSPDVRTPPKARRDGASINEDFIDPEKKHRNGAMLYGSQMTAIRADNASCPFSSNEAHQRKVCAASRSTLACPSKVKNMDVWKLSCEPQGCRAIQKMFDECTNDEKQAIAKQLHGHAWEALHDPHANHVLQKCIITTEPKHSQFIIEEICQEGEGVLTAARHRYGCRIVERLLEHCPPEQVRQMVDDIVVSCLDLCNDPYGNYVVQTVLEHGTPEQKHELCMTLESHAPVLGFNCHACAVIAKVFCHGSSEDKASFANALLQVPSLLGTMANSKRGHIAAKQMLQFVRGPQLEKAKSQLAMGAQPYSRSKHGRFVAANLDQPRNSRCRGGA